MQQEAIRAKCRFCKQIADALHTTGLSMELVALIFRYSGITIPALELDKHEQTLLSIESWDQIRQAQLWVEVPMDAELLHKLAKVKLITYSSHTHEKSYESPERDDISSWFDLAILSRSASEVRCPSCLLCDANLLRRSGLSSPETQHYLNYAHGDRVKTALGFHGLAIAIIIEGGILAWILIAPMKYGGI